MSVPIISSEEKKIEEAGQTCPAFVLFRAIMQKEHYEEKGTVTTWRNTTTG